MSNARSGNRSAWSTIAASSRRLLGTRRRRLIAALLIVVIAVRAGLPYAARKIAIDQADQALVGRADVADIDLALLRGLVTLHSLRVYAQDAPAVAAAGETTASPTHDDATTAATAGAIADSKTASADERQPARVNADAPLFAAERLAVNLGWLGFFRKTVEVQGIEVENFDLDLIRARDGAIVAPRPVASEQPAEDASEDEGAGWGVLIERVALRDGRIAFRDYSVSESPEKIDASIPNLDAEHLALLITEEGLRPGTMMLDAGIKDGRLHLESTLENVDAGTVVESHLVLTDLPVGDARAYIPNVGWTDLDGRLDLDLVHRFEPGGTNVLLGNVALRGVSVHVADLGEPALSCGKLGLDIASIDLAKRHARLSSVDVDGLHLIAQPAGPEPLPLLRGMIAVGEERVTEAIDGSAPPSDVSAVKEDAAETAQPWSWKVDRLVVRNSNVKTIGADGALDVGVTAKAAPFTSASNERTTVEIELTPPEGTLSLTGAATLDPPAFDGKLRLEQLLLPPLTTPIATPVTRLLRKGVVSADLEVSLGKNTSAPENGARMAGAISVSDFEIAGEDPKLGALRWLDLSLEIRELLAPGVLLPAGKSSSQPIDVALASIKMERPKIVVLRTAKGISLPGGLTAAELQGNGEPDQSAEAPGDDESAQPADAQGSEEPAQPAHDAGTPAPASAGPQIRLKVDRVNVAQLRVTMTDKAVEPVYHSSIDPLDLTATDLRWPGPFASDVNLTAKGLQGAKLSVTGALEPEGSELTAKLDGLPLAPLNPYAVATGYGLGGGTASLKSKIKMTPASYATQNDLVLSQLNVRAGSGDSLFAAEFGMPLSLALALMTDLEGNIALSLPVVSDRSGTSVAIGTLVRNALARAVLNAATSPLKLIGAVANIGEKPASLVPPPLAFELGRATLASGEDQKLEQLSKMLAGAPNLTLNLHGETGDEDRRWLAEQDLRTRLEEEGGVFGALRHIGEGDEREAALEVLEARAEGKSAELPAEHTEWFEEQVARHEIPDAELLALAEQRTQLVQSRLTEAGTQADRITIEPTAPEDLGARPVVALTFATKSP